MLIIIDHDNCQHADAFSERCLGKTIKDPLGHERYCMRHLEDDGKEELTVVLIQDGKRHTIVLKDQEARDRASLGELVVFETQDVAEVAAF
jgi:hypothetical protein